MIMYFVFASLSIFVVFLNIRNEMVRRYSIDLTHRCWSVCDRYAGSIDPRISAEEFSRKKEVMDFNEKMWKDIEKATSYEKLLFSFKPLKDEYWLNEEQLNWISQYEDAAVETTD